MSLSMRLYVFKFLPVLDIDECALHNFCHVNATCINTEGSFRCICNPGHTGNGSTCFGKFQKFIYVIFKTRAGVLYQYLKLEVQNMIFILYSGANSTT